MSSDSVDSFYWIRVILASTWGTHGVGHIPNCDVRPHNSDADWRQNHRGKRHSQTTSPLHRRPQKSKATIHLILRVIVSLLCFFVLSSWPTDRPSLVRPFGRPVSDGVGLSVSEFPSLLPPTIVLDVLSMPVNMGRDTTCSTSPGTAKCTPSSKYSTARTCIAQPDEPAGHQIDPLLLRSVLKLPIKLFYMSIIKIINHHQSARVSNLYVTSQGPISHIE